MEVIGKANKYYTLWDKRSKAGNKSVYRYVKNISESFDKVREEYPDAEYLEWLRGSSTYEIDEDRLVRILTPGVMFFGRHAGCPVGEVPATYLAWMAENFRFSGPEEYDWWKNTFPEVKELLKNAGYIVLNIDGEYVQILHKSVAEEETGLPEDLLAGKPVEIDVTANPDEEGWTVVENVCFRFPEVKEMKYKDWTYYLPAVKNRGRKVKGKTLRISEYDITGITNNRICNLNGKIYTRALNVEIKKWDFVK